ncbi:MAG: NAD-dependent epimerase/dehydratase family protein [Oscillospiraceae bacterium]|nr:NAD-dependent epimerase/dehydratase family protein [Oscillospiraceae bacterium]
MIVNKLNNIIISEDVTRIISEDLPWEVFQGKTVLVTGANGMIPSYVVYTLLGLNDSRDLGVNILALVRNESKARKIFGELLERDDLALVVHDVTSPFFSIDDQKCDIDGPIDYVFHGASPARPQQHKSSPVDTLRANTYGTANLLELAVFKKAKGFVLFSSSEVYGTVNGIKSISEFDYGYLDPLNPRSCYPEGKRAAETLCASYQAQYGIPCCIPRFAHIYGPGMSASDGRVQADFAANVYRGENIVMKSDGSSQRAYTYVSDAVSGMFYALLKGTTANGMAYNIADSDNVISIRQLAEAFIACRKEKGLRLVIDIPESTNGLYNPAEFIGLDNSKIKALGWSPKIGLAEGVNRMVGHMEINGQ